MTVKKLTDSDKQEILNLYRHTGETTSTLAERYGVSNSTISRFLKSTLQEEDYESLIQQKRAARTSSGDTTQTPLFSEQEPSEPEPVLIAEPLVVETKAVEENPPAPTAKKLRQRSSVSKPEIKAPASAEQLQLLDTSSDDDPGVSTTTSPVQNIDESDFDDDIEVPTLEVPVSQPERFRPISVADSISSSLQEDANAEANTLAQMLGEDLLDDSEELTDLEDDDEDDDEEYVAETPKITRRVPSEMLVQVLPLSEANLPKTCYLVIDRASELITRPLRDFGDLGQIPTQEDQQKTLPVFDNHRVARRFSTKRDRVIKVPDSRMLQKARSHLQAKGITRLLVDGQVYSLSR